jgi:hypothetical protein
MHGPYLLFTLFVMDAIVEQIVASPDRSRRQTHTPTKTSSRTHADVDKFYVQRGAFDFDIFRTFSRAIFTPRAPLSHPTPTQSHICAFRRLLSTAPTPFSSPPTSYSLLSCSHSLPSPFYFVSTPFYFKLELYKRTACSCESIILSSLLQAPCAHTL